ncbi:MAG TPA: serine hydrolase domain-containing protein [Pyrinomonadaceae bacterium]|nr:serine hydrolase domain-containing protein [Pyrinomonadaceae bacterium]
MNSDNSTTDERIDALLAARIAAGDFPSAVYLVAERGRARFHGAQGFAVREPVRHAATVETIYDLASLTKPLVTGLLSARLVERGELELERTVATYLPEFARGATAGVTVRHLLTHTSGLPAWRPLRISTGNRRERVPDAIAAGGLEYEPGSRVVYSDLGFITLGLLLERIRGESLKELAEREIFRPLKLERTFFNPERAFLTGTAACEMGGNAYERGMCETQGQAAVQAAVQAGAQVEARAEAAAAENGGAWREELIWGEVHDGNAYFLGGAAGHAGLFSNARETLRLAEQFVAARTELLAPETCALFRTDMTPNLDEARSFAWQLAATKDSTASGALSPDSFGHLGFTGTSCWIDAARERVFILLTNRTHTRTLPFVNINGVRRRFHTLAVAALERDGGAGEAL